MQGNELLNFIASFSAGSLEQRCLANALELAKICHEGQKRKFTNEDYIVHPVEVAETLLSFGISDVPTITAALLHDVIEDCQFPTKAAIRAKCGPLVESYVIGCTNRYTPVLYKGMNRAARKSMEVQRLSKCPEAVQNIKMADALSNLRTVDLFDEKFRGIYCSEKLALAQHLTLAEAQLRQEVFEILEEKMR